MEVPRLMLIGPSRVTVQRDGDLDQLGLGQVTTLKALV